MLNGLPLVMARGPMLIRLVREAAQDPRRYRPCGCCGARILVCAGEQDQPVRCVGCMSMLRMTEARERPWRLTPAMAEALRRTKSWVRWIA